MVVIRVKNSNGTNGYIRKSAYKPVWDSSTPKREFSTVRKAENFIKKNGKSWAEMNWTLEIETV